MEQSIKTVLTKPSELLSGLLDKVDLLHHLTDLLHRYLEPSFRSHCRVANLRQNILVLEIDNAAWATQIRYRLPELVRQFRQTTELRNLESIEWYLQPINKELL